MKMAQMAAYTVRPSNNKYTKCNCIFALHCIMQSNNTRANAKSKPTDGTQNNYANDQIIPEISQSGNSETDYGGNGQLEAKYFKFRSECIRFLRICKRLIKSYRFWTCCRTHSCQYQWSISKSCYVRMFWAT